MTNAHQHRGSADTPVRFTPQEWAALNGGQRSRILDLQAQARAKATPPPHQQGAQHPCDDKDSVFYSREPQQGPKPGWPDAQAMVDGYRAQQGAQGGEREAFEQSRRALGWGTKVDPDAGCKLLARHTSETWAGSNPPTYRSRWTEAQWVGWQAKAAQVAQRLTEDQLLTMWKYESGKSGYNSHELPVRYARAVLRAAQGAQGRVGLTFDDKAALRKAVMAAFSERIPALSRHDDWRDWPGTFVFADIALSVLLDREGG